MYAASTTSRKHKPLKYEPKSLNTRHNEILRLWHMGLPHSEIAKQVGCTVHVVKYVTGGELGQAKLAEMETMSDIDVSDLEREIRLMCPQVLEFYRGVIGGTEDGATPGLRFKVGSDILDRAGVSRVQKVKGAMLHGYVGRVGISNIKKRAREAGILDEEDAIDVEVTNAEGD